jgi:hypothetical protein
MADAEWSMQRMAHAVHRPSAICGSGIVAARAGSVRSQLVVGGLGGEAAEWLMGDATALYTIVLLHHPFIIHAHGATPARPNGRWPMLADANPGFASAIAQTVTPPQPLP